MGHILLCTGRASYRSFEGNVEGLDYIAVHVGRRREGNPYVSMSSGDMQEVTLTRAEPIELGRARLNPAIQEVEQLPPW